MLYKKLAKASPGAVIRLVMDALDDEPYVSSQMGPLIHHFQDSRVLIETFPNPEELEGCILYISSIPEKEGLGIERLPTAELSPVEPVVFRFQELTCLNKRITAMASAC